MTRFVFLSLSFAVEKELEDLEDTGSTPNDAKVSFHVVSTE